jgi:hypothetical protein
MKKDSIDPNIIIKATVSLAAIFLVYKIAQKLGLIPSKDDKKEEANLLALEGSSYWNYNDFLQKAPPGHALLTQAGAAAYVEDLWNATGIFDDDEEKIYGVFRAMRTQSQIAALAKRFNQLKTKDLYGYLKDYLNETELLTIKNIIDQKPKYFA